MENKGAGVLRKRLKPTVEDGEDNVGDGTLTVAPEQVENEANVAGSEEMELKINHIMEQMDQFTQLVSELMESSKTMFKDLSNEFEERLVMIHKEQVEKWQEEIKELRELDSMNEGASALLHNARYLVHGPQYES